MKTTYTLGNPDLASRRPICLLLAVAITILLPSASAAVLTVDLGAAADFAILAGSGVSNAGATTITGDVGSSPTPTTAGFGSVTLIGTNHEGDAFTVAAKESLANAYGDAEARTPTTIYGPILDLGGRTLTTGVYNDPSSFGITGTLTLDAQNDPSAVWIFQAGSTLITGANSSVVLINGALAANVFWQVGSSATLGTNSLFTGTLMAFTSITAESGAIVNGRLLAQNGAVSLVSNTVTAVPEPGVVLLLGVGLGILVLQRRSRNRKNRSLPHLLHAAPIPARKGLNRSEPQSCPQLPRLYFLRGPARKSSPGSLLAAVRGSAPSAVRDQINDVV